jgi:membrane associated rhomboid family serine protease
MKASTITPIGVRPRTLKPWLFGVIAGVVFVGAEAALGIYPPSAYAFCLACHVRDLVNTAWSAVFGAALETAGIARRALLLTSPGVLLGAFAAAALFRERRRQPLGRPLPYFLAGLAVMTIGIVIFGCPTRIVLRAGYGEVYGIAALAGLLAGIACGTLLLRRRARSS